MVLKKVDLEATPLTLEQLLAELEHHGEVLLTRGDDPVARLSPVEKVVTPKERILGLHEGQAWVSEDFDDELPDSFWLGDDE
jgi:antitoxin (DNA-binding transcriptional repressor) of toxin-antitoxin stability system